MRQNTLEKIAAIKTWRFGVEVEMACIRRERAAKYLAEFWHTETTVGYGGSYGRWWCEDNQGRKWQFLSDSSIQDGNGCQDDYGGCELVTPILEYKDIEMLQDVIRLLRKKGAKSDPNHDCGIHVHVDVASMDTKGLLNLTNLMASHDKLIMAAISVAPERERWCRPVHENFLKEVNKQKPSTLDEFKHVWYSSQGYSDWASDDHYNDSRYTILNFHSLWQGKGIEFRCFQFANATGERRGGLHAGELKAYIQLCLAICETAHTATTIKCKPSKLQEDNPQFAMKRFLRKLGLKGKEFNTCRDLMFKHLDGDYRVRHVTEVA